MSNKSADQLREELYQSRKQVYDKARGHWPRILTGAGVPDHYLRLKKAGPCPLCNDGDDRYTFDDRKGDGDYFCRVCGPGKGVTFLMKYRGEEWPDVVDWVLAFLQDPDNRALLAERDDRIAAYQRSLSETEEQKRRRRFQEVWKGARRIEEGDPVHRYLTRRVPGLVTIPSVLRYHPELDYYAPPEVKDGSPVFMGRFPAMVAAVQDPSGTVGNIHRTYLTPEGEKAKIISGDGEILDVKKLMPTVYAKSTAIRLAGESRELGVAEGIETALAAQVFAGVPTWSVVNTAGMKGFEIPPWVEVLTIFADNDRPDQHGRRAGFDAAHALASREDVVALVKQRKLRVNVRAPSTVGTDIADLLMKIAAREPASHA